MLLSPVFRSSVHVHTSTHTHNPLLLLLVVLLETTHLIGVISEETTSPLMQNTLVPFDLSYSLTRFIDVHLFNRRPKESLQFPL